MMALYVQQLLREDLKHVIQWDVVLRQTLAVEVGVAGVAALRASTPLRPYLSRLPSFITLRQRSKNLLVFSKPPLHVIVIVSPILLTFIYCGILPYFVL